MNLQVWPLITLVSSLLFSQLFYFFHSNWHVSEECCISLTLQMKRPPAFELWHRMPTKQILQVQSSQLWTIMVVWSLRPTWSFHKQKSSICHGCFWQLMTTWWITHAVLSKRTAAGLWGWLKQTSLKRQRSSGSAGGIKPSSGDDPRAGIRCGNAQTNNRARPHEVNIRCHIQKSLVRWHMQHTAQRNICT